MKRIAILSLIISCCWQLAETISVHDYIQQHGQPNYGNLQDAGLTSLEGLDELENKDTITELSLDRNNISTIEPGTFDKFINLESLHLKENNLSELPIDLFYALPRLRQLNLSSNKFTTLPEKIFDTDKLKQLETLLLYDNQLEELPLTFFDQLSNLKQLSIFANQFQENTEEFKKKYNLERVKSVYLKEPEQEEAEQLQKDLINAIKNKQSYQNLKALTKQLALQPGREFWIGDTDIIDHMVPIRDEEGNTIGNIAVLTGNQTLIKLISENLPELMRAKNSKGETALHTAVLLDAHPTHVKRIIVQILETDPDLLGISNDDGKTPVQYAASKPELLKFLLDQQKS